MKQLRSRLPHLIPIALLVAGAFGVVGCVLRSSDGVNDWWASRGPVVPHETFPGDCTLCHTSSRWNALRADFTFDHLAETGYALSGQHQEAQCLRCHNDRGPVQEFSDRGCAGCHGDIHNNRLGDSCLDCHTEEDWRPQGQLAEHARTRFPLFGAHAAVTCNRCHVGIGSGVFDPLSIECVSCHQADLAVAVPDHFQEGWIESCERCHRATSWAEEGFAHDFFPLTGGHNIQCADCHTNESFDPVSTECNDCHQGSFTLSTSLDHEAFNLPRACERCHTASSWIPADFDHSVTQNDCADCHLPEYFATSAPDHQLWGYSQDCVSCHTTDSWPQIQFGHPGIVTDCMQCHLQEYLNTNDPDHQLWGYPTNCELCHHQFTSFPPADNRHEGTVDGCVQCHFQDYLMTTNPNHVAEGFPLQCQFCHVADVSWDVPLGSLRTPDLKAPAGVDVKPLDPGKHSTPRRERPRREKGGF